MSSYTSSSSSQNSQGLSRPNMIRFLSSPNVGTKSPTRHHFRLSNEGPRQIKETRDAKWSVDSVSGKKLLNQYLLEEDIGKGSFGSVKLGIDVGTKTKYAVKEYSKAQLRKVRRTEAMQRRRRRESKPLIDMADDSDNSMNLVRREIAIMKKLDHPNIVSLIEVLDDPLDDKLYMVLDWCSKGVILPGDYSNPQHGPSPYSEEQCRLFFRDMILGLEYLHCQGVVHRDIKIENILLSEDNVVKIVDFGVSEIFEKIDRDPVIKRTAGSPAYMAPELALISSGYWLTNPPTPTAKEMAGKPTDIWSLGVTLFCIYFGTLPFRSDTVQGLYEKILNSEPEELDDSSLSPTLKDLFCRILEKDSNKRIKMAELREHPWVTLNGEDPLLSTEENTGGTISVITESDLKSAIEQVERVMDLDLASQRLEKLHGWRGRLSRESSSTLSLSPTIEIAQNPLETSGRQMAPEQEKEKESEIPSMSKLIAALDEVISTHQGGKSNNRKEEDSSSIAYSSDESFTSSSPSITSNSSANETS